MVGSDGDFACPECDNALPDGARFCPACASALTAGGSVVDLEDPESLPDDVDLEDLSAVYDPDEQSSLVDVDDAGRRRASRRIRVVAGLAVSIPIAPLVLFLVSSVVSLTPLTAGITFLLGWIGPAALLARSNEPVLAFGRSLYLLALGTTLIPVTVVIGDDATLPGGLGVDFTTLTAVVLLIGALALTLGRFVTMQAGRNPLGDVAGPKSEDTE